MTSAMITAIGTIGTFLVALLTFYFGVYIPFQEEHLPSPPSSDTTKNVTSSSPPSLEPDVTSTTTTKQETPPPPVVCSRNYHFDTSLNKCIPDLVPKEP